MFLRKDNFREYVNPTAIVELTHRESDGIRTTYALMRDGSTVPLFGRLDEILLSCCPAVAAAPGFERLLGYYNDDDDADDQHWVRREPIVAWRITDDRPLPITPQMEGGENVMSEVIKYPGGRIVCWHFVLESFFGVITRLGWISVVFWLCGGGRFYHLCHSKLQ
jgi:hypothetical protein